MPVVMTALRNSITTCGFPLRLAGRHFKLKGFDKPSRTIKPDCKQRLEVFMDGRIFLTTEMVGRVVHFGVTHPELFPEDLLGAKTFEALGTAQSKLSEQAIAQLAFKNAVRINTKARADAREVLRVMLEDTTRTAAAIAIDLPDLKGKLKAPEARRDTAMIYAGLLFADK